MRISKKEFHNKLHSREKTRFENFFYKNSFIFYRNSKKSIVFKILAILDSWIFKFKFLRFLAWSTLIVANKT